MKDKTEIEDALGNVYTHESNYPAMTYENGVDEALSWVLENIPDEEFEYSKGG